MSRHSEGYGNLHYCVWGAQNHHFKLWITCQEPGLDSRVALHVSPTLCRRVPEELTHSLPKFLQHKGLAQVLHVVDVRLQPGLTKAQVGAAPIVGPHVDAAIVDAIGQVVGQEVVAGVKAPCAAGTARAVGHRVGPAGQQPDSAWQGLRNRRGQGCSWLQGLAGA